TIEGNKMKNDNLRKLLGLIGISLFLFTGCQRQKVEFDNPIKPLRDAGQVHEFIQNHHFHLSKHPNIYFIFFDTLRPDYALEQPTFKEFFDKNFSFSHSYGSATSTWYSTF